MVGLPNIGFTALILVEPVVWFDRSPTKLVQHRNGGLSRSSNIGPIWRLAKGTVLFRVNKDITQEAIPGLGDGVLKAFFAFDLVPELCPQLDLSHGGRDPRVLGGTDLPDKGGEKTSSKAWGPMTLTAMGRILRMLSHEAPKIGVS